MKTICFFTLAMFIATLGYSQRFISPKITPGEEVVIPDEKVKVSGSLLLPANESNEKVPVFIFISGSGDFSYRSHFHPDARYTFCKDLSDVLLARGYAVFFLEKRGINNAGGNWRKAGFREYAADVNKVISHLKEIPVIDTTRIGLIGHSQGGYIGQVVAALNPADVSMLINLVGPAQKVRDQVLFDMHNQYSCRGYNNFKLNLKMSMLNVSLFAVKHSSCLIKPVFLSHVIRHDPARYIPLIQCPVLTIYAENDYMVDDVENTQLMTSLLRNEDSKNSIHTIKEVNHHFFRSEICYNWDETDKTVHPELFEIIGDWLETVDAETIIK